MAKVKIIGIIGIVTALGHIYKIGEGPVHLDGAPEVEKINYESLVYNNGNQSRKPAYVVFFNDSPVRHIIPEDKVVEILVDSSKVEKDDEAVIPDLPAADQAEETS